MGQTFDQCTGSCVGKATVVLNPDSAQSGLINITGDLKSAGDLYLANGKAIRADGTGQTILKMGNWGNGPFGLQVKGQASFGAFDIDSTGIFLTTPSLFASKALIGLNAPSPVDNGLSVAGGLRVGTGATPGLQVNSNGDLFITGQMGVGSSAPNASAKGVGVEGQLITKGQMTAKNGLVVESGGITLGGENKTSWPTNGATYTGTTDQISINASNQIGFVMNPKITGDLIVYGAGNSIFNGRVGIGTGSNIDTATLLDVNGKIKAQELCLSGTGTKVCNNFWPTSSQWVTSGSDIYYGNLNGNVGIGKINPSSTLDVAGSANISGSTTVGETLFVKTLAQNWTGVSSYFKGNVGIGTETPSKLLHLKTGAGNNAELDIQSGAKAKWGIYHDELTEQLRFWNSSNQMIITKDGKVGIGTGKDVPVEALDVTGNIKVSGSATFNGNTLIGEADYFNIKSKNGLQLWLDANSGTSGNPFKIIGPSGSYIFKVDQSGNVVASGNLGLGGITAPTETLDVAGNIKASGKITADGDLFSGSRLRFSKANAGAGDKAIIALDAGAGKKIIFYNYDNSKTLMTIDGDTGKITVPGNLTVEGALTGGAIGPVGSSYTIYRCTDTTNKGMLTVDTALCGGSSKAVVTGLSAK